MTEQEKQEQTAERRRRRAAAPRATAASSAEARRAARRAGRRARRPADRRRRCRSDVPGTPVVSRRRVLQIGFWASLGACVAGIGACGLDLIYPRTSPASAAPSPPATSPYPAGQKTQIPEGRFWLVNLTAEQGGPGLLALWWKCPHLGCTVPWRPTFVWPDPTTGAPKQGWFRCPCHGSTYTDAGVRVFGPAPRSMDTMAITVDRRRRSHCQHRQRHQRRAGQPGPRSAHLAATQQKERKEADEHRQADQCHGGRPLPAR